MKFYNDPVYIKMCEKAEEIQKIWQSMCNRQEGQNFYWNSHFEKGYEGSFYKMKTDIGDEVSCVDYEYSTNTLDGNTDIWLPRQDQLQEMIPPKGALQMFGVMFNLATEIAKDDKNDFKTIEQYLLAIVMKHKFNKTWDGENWIEVTK